MAIYLDFEKDLAEIQSKISDLESLPDSSDSKNIKNEIELLKTKSADVLKDLYGEMNPWRKCQVARHPERPHTKDYIDYMISEYTPLSGDRNFAEDLAIVGGLGRLQDTPVVVLGHEKGNTTESRLQRNFGMARPEGYRKATRLMKLADKFGLPIITFIDTPGAYPGKGAEERGQAEAIARSTQTCLEVTVPIISIIIGEGGSGGAIAMASANTLIMLEHSIYSVISPEGCASILWKNSDKMREAADALKLTAQHLEKLGVVDKIINEPLGGAHRNKNKALEDVKNTVLKEVISFQKIDRQQIKRQRAEKYINMGSLSSL
ncbi:MAG: acetyl-coenzyme A carboxylase carboxyl transferase subunit alpha [Paracoccaceae bacterium]|nr:MAG: acetyl-coenzyme A carboxylase carboxyl transferase subunit alpha [Paracoccaceae bacterium]